MIAGALGWASYGLIVWALALIVMRVMGPSPEYMGGANQTINGRSADVIFHSAV